MGAYSASPFNTFALCVSCPLRPPCRCPKTRTTCPIFQSTPDFILRHFEEKAIRINDRNSDHCFYVSNFSGKYSDVWGECMDKMFFSDGKVLFNFAGMNRVTLIPPAWKPGLWHLPGSQGQRNAERILLPG